MLVDAGPQSVNPFRAQNSDAEPRLAAASSNAAMSITIAPPSSDALSVHSGEGVSSSKWWSSSSWSADEDADIAAAPSAASDVNSAAAVVVAEALVLQSTMIARLK
mmetsp:Transcript_50724/g.108111  ORF Transcript_50724/g.108111 Transcript_50724/m.108111 type:complete len:106 (-) Transcript_50724:113-430(-)